MESNKFVIVDTEYGPVKGAKKVTVLGNNYINFQGIPYMKAPIGKLRFRVKSLMFLSMYMNFLMNCYLFYRTHKHQKNGMNLLMQQKKVHVFQFLILWH